MVPKSKNILTILIFFLSPLNLLSYPIDRSRSQLSISFFLASLRFLQRPKRPLLFCQNFEPAGKKILKRGKKIRKYLWINFEFCGKNPRIWKKNARSGKKIQLRKRSVVMVQVTVVLKSINEHGQQWHIEIEFWCFQNVKSDKM